MATYGIEEIQIVPDRISLKHKVGIRQHEKMLLFNGTLDYKPNYDAVVTLVDEIEPCLRNSGVAYKIIITGNRAPADLVKKMLSNTSISYAGYVEKVDDYYQAADLFLNPVTNDSGVKTKVIEAIANHCTVISTESGISGIAMETCPDKIHMIPGNDWKRFADVILQQLSLLQPETPPAFYEYYSWKNIARHVSSVIENVTNEYAS